MTCGWNLNTFFIHDRDALMITSDWSRWRTDSYLPSVRSAFLYCLTSLCSLLLCPPDPAVDDFVLMHCVFMANTQMCPLLMAQYPFLAFALQLSLWNRLQANGTHLLSAATSANPCAVVTACVTTQWTVYYCVFAARYGSFVSVVQ